MDYAYLQLLIVKYRPCTVINQKSVENKIIEKHYLFRYLPLDFTFVVNKCLCRVLFRWQLLLCVYVSNFGQLSA